MSFLHVADVAKTIGKETVLKETNFQLQQFYKIAVAGETGSGKSTLLKIIAGLVQPDTGKVLFEGKRILGPDEKLIPGHPGISYLSQHFELPNYLTVAQVLTYANQMSEKKASRLFEICRIDHLLPRRTDQLSGGEKQRIALAKLLITSPKLLLLDEPFSNLDMIHKNILKSVVRDLGEELAITCMLISHDPMDTLSWADEIIVMKNGNIVQQGKPRHIYKKPADEYTGALFGSYNLLSLSQAEAFASFHPLELNGKDLFIRPEDLRIVPKEQHAVKGMVKRVRLLGAYNEIELECAGSPLIVKAAPYPVSEGSEVSISLNPSEVWYIKA